MNTAANLNHEVTTSYLVPVYVQDNKDAAGVTDGIVDDVILVTINVTNVNEAPTITGGAITITRQENTSTSTVIDIFEASDEDDPTTFTWTLEGADAGDFTITRNSDGEGELKFRVVPNYEMPADDGANNSYNVTVKVSDGSLSDVRDVTVTVTDVNEAPVITTTGSSHTSISVPEGTATSEVLATYMANDPDAGDSLTWFLFNHDAGDFTIVGGVLKFSSVPNFESPADNGGNNVYDMTVNVRDNTGSGADNSINVTVNVTNVDEPGTASFSGALLGGSTLTASVTDPDVINGTPSYQWQRGNTSSGSFSNIPANGTSETYVPVAADVGKYLKVQVSYADMQGSGKMATSAARGPVGASNSEPTFSAMTATRTLPENSSSGDERRECGGSNRRRQRHADLRA